MDGRTGAGVERARERLEAPQRLARSSRRRRRARAGARAGRGARAAAPRELEASLPQQVGEAVRDGLRARGRCRSHATSPRSAGSPGQTIRRLERLEGDLLAERHARVDDLALLVDLISSGWKSVDERLARIETAAQQANGAIVYRMEDAQERRAG